MLLSVLAKIMWISASNGGGKRPPPPQNTTYAPTSKFDELPDETWSMIVEILTPVDTSGRFTAKVRFLVETAPQHLLCYGSRFSIYEGAVKVAEGEITETAPSK